MSLYTCISITHALHLFLAARSIRRSRVRRSRLSALRPDSGQNLHPFAGVRTRGQYLSWQSKHISLVNTCLLFIYVCGEFTYRQPAQNDVLTDLICRAIFCIYLSILHMQIGTTIILSDNWSELF